MNTITSDRLFFEIADWLFGPCNGTGRRIPIKLWSWLMLQFWNPNYYAAHSSASAFYFWEREHLLTPRDAEQRKSKFTVSARARFARGEVVWWRGRKTRKIRPNEFGKKTQLALVGKWWSLWTPSGSNGERIHSQRFGHFLDLYIIPPFSHNTILPVSTSHWVRKVRNETVPLFLPCCCTFI